MALISVTEARRLILCDAAPNGTERVALNRAVGRVLAENLHALRAQPPYNASAMDGYAVRVEDAGLEQDLKIIGEAPAGTPFTGSIGPGECVRVFTGSQMPQGSSHIVIQENVRRDGDRITINVAHKAPAHIRRRGIDFDLDQKLAESGTCLSAIQGSVLASAGQSDLKVFRKPRIAIFANGDELVEIGQTAGPDDILSSTPVALTHWVNQWGGEAQYLGIARDNTDSLQSMISKARDFDLIVPLGGASVGDYDLVKDAFNAADYKSVFSKIAVKPGKPTWYGRLEHAHILGLPGNPASALVCAEVFLRPLVKALSGQSVTPELPLLSARLSEAMPANGPRALFARARADVSCDGHLQVRPFPRQDSSLLTPFARSNCFIYQPADHPGADRDGLIGIMRLHGTDL